MENKKFTPAIITAFVLIFGGIFIGDCINRTVGFFVLLLGCIVAAAGLIQRGMRK